MQKDSILFYLAKQEKDTTTRSQWGLLLAKLQKDNNITHEILDVLKPINFNVVKF